MVSLTINMLFWTDGIENSTRERNIKYSVKCLKELSDFFNTKINCNYKIYDYSPVKIIEEAIHIPYPVGVYKRSEKINNVLKNTDTDLFSVIDSDCFIKKEDYSALLEEIITNGKDSCYTFDVCDFGNSDTDKIIYENADPNSFTTSSRFPGRAGMLGAFFITNTENLKKHGGFNEKFKTWGGEDGEIYDKIWYDGSVKKVGLNCNKVKLYHLSHFSDRGNINYFDDEEYRRNNFH